MFTFKLEYGDGAAAEPATFETTVPAWRAGDQIFLGPGRVLRVVDVRDEGGVLVVERVG